MLSLSFSVLLRLLIETAVELTDALDR